MKYLIFVVVFLWCHPVFSGGLYDEIIERESKRSGVVPDLIRAVIRVESNGKLGALSPKGAGGLMQLMPATAARFGVKSVYDPAQNIRGGTTYLAWLYRRYGNWALALAGYNAGEGAVDKYNGIPPYQETQSYVVKVLAAYRKLSKSAPVVPLVVAPVPAVTPVASVPVPVVVAAKPVKISVEKAVVVKAKDKIVSTQGHEKNLFKAALVAPTIVVWDAPTGYYD